MKRHVLIAICLLATVGVVTAVFAGIRRAKSPVMNVRFNKRDFPEHGVHLVTPLDPSFDTDAQKHFNHKIPENLKPFSVFIRNSGKRMIVAYSLTWKFVDENGRVITRKSVGYTEPGILMGDELPPEAAAT